MKQTVFICVVQIEKLIGVHGCELLNFREKKNIDFNNRLRLNVTVRLLRMFSLRMFLLLLMVDVLLLTLELLYFWCAVKTVIVN